MRAYLLQTHEMLFDAQNHDFSVLGGVPRRGIYDNMRTAVDRIAPSRERHVVHGGEKVRHRSGGMMLLRAQ